MRIITETVVVTERDDGWLMQWSEGGESTVKSAAAALRHVRGWGRDLADRGVSSRITLEWHPRTAIGRQVVRALQG